MELEREFHFTRDDFDYLRNLVMQNTGIIADEDKYTMYYSRLSRRIRALGLKNFAEYRGYLDQHRETELIELVNSVTTNLTSFFRENHHFEFIRDSIIPNLKKEGRRKIRIWSAGCSTGEEPCSIAITLAQAIPDYKKWDIKILATDLDSHVIRKASSASYETARVKPVQKAFLERYFIRDNTGTEGVFKVHTDLLNLIQFKQLNLLHGWPPMDRMDMIFCRNVVIYFDKPTRNKLVDRFAECMVDHGYLFMGHSESLFGSTERFKSLGKTIYQKSL
jgi:chemotaxis protein methyltransferase CheR